MIGSMRRVSTGLIIALFASYAASAASSRQPVPSARQLNGLTLDEAAKLLDKIEDAQRQLKAGRPQYFELLSGSIAAFEMTKVAPREVFLTIPFNRVWNIERVQTDVRTWKPYRLAYAPNGLGEMYWDIEVDLDLNGDIQRVLMIYKPPAPF